MAGLVGLLATAAVAQEAHRFTRARLVWRVAPGLAGCPGEETFRREVARRLGAVPFEDGADSVVTVSIEPTDDGALLGRTQTLLPDGAASPGTPVRVARGACRDLVSLLAGRIAVYLEDVAASAPPDVAPPDATPPAVDAAPSATDATAPADVSSDDPAPPPSDARPPRPVAAPTWRFEVGGGAVGERLGDDPLWAAGLYAEGRVRRGALSLGAELVALLPSSEATPSADVSVRALSGRAAAVACVLPWRLGLCVVVGGSLTRLTLRGAHGAADDEPVLALAVVGPRVTFDAWRLGPFALTLRVEGLWVPAPAELRFPDGRAWREDWHLSVGVGGRWMIP